MIRSKPDEATRLATLRPTLPVSARAHVTMFHEQDDIKLIRLVKENSVLYDVSHAKYIDFNTREVAWQKIGDELERPAADCKVRWINIRDVHRRILKKNMSDPTHRPKLYKYDAELEFMKKFYRDMPSLEEDIPKDSSTIWDEDMNQEPDHDQLSDDYEVPVKRVKTKKKRSKKKEPCFVEVSETRSSFGEIQSVQSELDSADPIDAFLLSIGATLKSFSPYHLNVAKSKIFAVVQEHDLQQIVERQKASESEGNVSTSDRF